MNQKRAGFSVIEMMVVLAILAILLMMMIPTAVDKVIREQINAALPLADIAKEPIQASWKAEQVFPANNEEAELPAPEKIVNNLVQSIEVSEGVINITFGNRAHTQIQGKTVTLRPAVIEDSPIVPITWVCAKALVPANMTVHGSDNTDIPVAFLPNLCK
jgi:type IV pilus assembly protein PilA